MDTIRARQIMQSGDAVQVLHRGSPVWIEKVMDNNTAEITYLGTEKNDRREVVPVYLLVENKPV